ncbi:50S ribosome-binding GTPase [Pasteurella atlantica]|uniref:GTPase family protein n=1 Tax=Pasteurellaceae TaxID=712 RepID=UPI00274BE4B8|nr:GTPase [Pasteurella atlantica]MDP8034358.1 50S ribosome-binding GTPase [Pasteurella atlantica]MDP8036257.1 50S ribosome-binding GTPase [Pasteurella atlantica]MDP8038241.1 50S ribosome-binding GTPase [Pasteurella atlantica]MDP8048562.1 50S ribosome-binding GTPase [Pasteurella atlantica]MDP8050552.1 50S ribosome-binding GTPase [Pasteurella atlantica]
MQNSIKSTDLKSYLANVTKYYSKPYFNIGIMGKSGAGKSSLINALISKPVCKTGSVGGCTREIQTINSQLYSTRINLIDFPGIAENEKWDQKYKNLYKEHLDDLDLIIWLIKIDDRALFEDENFYNDCLQVHSNKLLLVLSQTDKTEPKREWNNYSFEPSTSQQENINRNLYRIFSEFYEDKIIPIAHYYDGSSYQRYNFDKIFDQILFKIVQDSNVTNNISVSENWAMMKYEINTNTEMQKMIFAFLEEDTNKILEELNSFL